MTGIPLCLGANRADSNPLSENEPTEEDDLPEKKKKGCSGCLLRLGILGLLFLALLIGGIIWFSGPGFRWLAQKYGPELLVENGFQGDFQLSGSLLKGPNIDSINLTSETSPLKTLSATNLKLRYNLFDLKDLKIEGITANSLTVDLDLSQSSPKPEKEKKEPSQTTLSETLAKYRSIATHPQIEIGDLNLHVHKADQNFYRLQNASLAHAAKSDTFSLTPGTVTDFEDKSFQPPTAEITWQEDNLNLAQIPLAQDISVPGLRFELDPLLLDGNLTIFGSSLTFNTDIKSEVTASLGTQNLDLAPLLEVIPAAKEATCIITDFQATASQLDQEFSQWALDLTLTLDDLSFQNRAIPSTTLELLKSELDLDTTLSVTLPEQTQVVSLITNFAPETAQSPSTAWKNSRSDLTTELPSLGSFLAGIAPTLNLPVPPDGWPDGKALLLANIGLKDGQPHASKASLSFNRLNWAEAEFEKGELTVDYIDANSDIKADLIIEQSATSTLTSRASFQPQEQSYAATFSAKNFDAQTLQPFIRLSLGNIPLAGTISLDWKGSGDLPDLNTHRGNLTLNQTRVSIDKQQPIRLNFAANYEGTKRVEISQLEVQQNDQILQAQALWNGERVELSKLSFTQAQKELVTGEASLPLSLDMDFKNYLALEEPWSAQLNVDRLDIPETAEMFGFASALPDGFSGIITLDVDIAGNPATPAISTNLLFESDQRLEARANWNGERVEIPILSLTQAQQQLVTGNISLPLSLETDFKKYLAVEDPWSVNLNVDQLDIPETAKLLGMSSKVPEGLAGILTLDIDVGGSPATPALAGRLLLDSFALQNISQLPPTTARLAWATAGSTLTLDGTLEPDGRNPLVITGSTAFHPKKWTENPDLFLDENFNLRVDAPNIELSPFADLSPTIKSLDGNLVVQLKADGTFRTPNLTGSLDLDLPKARFNIDRLRRVRQTSLKLDFANNRISISPFSTSIDGGLLDLNGTVDLTDTSNPAFDLRANIDKALLWRDDNINARGDAALFLKGSLQQARLSGEIGIVESLFYKDIELLPLNVPVSMPKAPTLPSVAKKPKTSGKENAIPIPEPYASWTIDLKATTADPFLIRGNLTSGEVIGDLTATGQLANPQLNGELVIEKLDAALPFSTLTIEGGKAIFSPKNGFIPALDIRAQSRIPPYEADLFVAGLATSPSISFASNPPLPENEVITLLATGTTTEALEDSDAAKSKAFQLLIEQVRRAPPGSRLHPFAKLAEPLKDVELQIASADPFTGKRRNSATVPIPRSERWFITAAADSESNTRGLVLYILKFR
ncbi:MAG: translocation/assembly module TamB domain-containing protein [Roseibacillus sp.]